MKSILCKCCHENIVKGVDREKGGKYKYFCKKCIEKYGDEEPPFRCYCGAEFKSDRELHNHRVYMNEHGHPCPRTQPLTKKCPYCGETILLSHHSDASAGPYESNRVHNRTCKVYQQLVKEFGKIQLSPIYKEMFSKNACSGKYIKGNLRSKKLDTRGYIYCNYGEVAVQQMMWVRNMFIDEKIPYHLSFGINRCKCIHNGIADLELLIEFDDEIFDCFLKPLLEEGWCIINLKWTDVILNEQKAIDLIKLCIEKQEKKLDIKK